MGARASLLAEGIAARVVSMPCWERFAEQPAAYREAVLAVNAFGCSSFPRLSYILFHKVDLAYGEISCSEYHEYAEEDQKREVGCVAPRVRSRSASPSASNR